MSTICGCVIKLFVKGRIGLSLQPKQLSALSRLFSSGVIREMATAGYSPLFARLLQTSGLITETLLEDNVGNAFDVAFSALNRVGNRDEYVYRAALTHRILLGKHSLKTASMLSEFRAGKSKADVVILNGTATVYEIKSERDSLARLAKQLEDYKKVFARAYVIVGETHVKSVLNETKENIGILSLSSRYRISTVREALDEPQNICPVSVFESLRSAEALEVLKFLGKEIPSMPNTKLRTAMREKFFALDPVDVHNATIKVLKSSRKLDSLQSLLDALPKSLYAAALSVPLKRSGHQFLVKSVNTPLNVAINWT